ncbi:hypothetical protein Nepgr_012427 [Nepenthes gracilis]|uniref:Uncharacterized protein n=1 Tax=Nepenthes gracilis TaxID=150966 RepID=A0AAD3SHH9_NEPGR|nr:hypothetical protein Nepgr_012427 [Nepenthes gracilis]
MLRWLVHLAEDWGIRSVVDVPSDGASVLWLCFTCLIMLRLPLFIVFKHCMDCIGVLLMLQKRGHQQLRKPVGQISKLIARSTSIAAPSAVLHSPTKVECIQSSSYSFDTHNVRVSCINLPRSIVGNAAASIFTNIHHATAPLHPANALGQFCIHHTSFKSKIQQQSQLNSKEAHQTHRGEMAEQHTSISMVVTAATS